MKKKFFITTPIYYINDVPHVGHAYTTIAADVLSRYYKAKGEDVFFLTGVDEHGAKIAEAAKKANLEPKAFADSLVPRFQEAWKKLNIEYSEFFRTTDPKHEAVVKDLITQLKDHGYVEKRKYNGLYCTACEKFLLPDELVDGCCPDHGTKPQEHSEENYFFLLGKAAKDGNLLEKIEKGEPEVAPIARKNEVIGKIKQGLEDVSISRQKVDWGIPFPGDESQTIYVWIDALINYYSAQKVYDREDLWPADIHLMAKDILWFHAIIWPAMLLALDLPLPKKVFAHGFFTVSGQKMSKTRGNVLDPNKLVEKFGADAVRYALLREFPFGEDGDISEEKIANRYQNELSNGLGNLLQRTIVMADKYSVKLSKPEILVIDKKVLGSDQTTRDVINRDIEDFQFSSVLVHIWKVISNANEIVDNEKPWILSKEQNNEKLSKVLNNIYDHILSVTELIMPFMPDTAEKMKKQLETLEPEPLFPRLQE